MTTSREHILSAGRFLVSLLRAFLNGAEPPPRPEGLSWELIYRLARAHNVEAMAYRAACSFPGDPLPPELESKWKTHALQAAMQSLLQSEELKKLTAHFKENAIPVCPLKGPWLKPLYPAPELRQMADLDLLIRDADREKARAVMEQSGWQCRFFREQNEDIYCRPPYLSVELHAAPVPERDPHRGYYDRKLREADGGWRWHTQPVRLEDQYLYLLAHLEKHLAQSGCGIRAIMDLALFRRKHEGDWDASYLEHECEIMHMTALRAELERLADRWFSAAPPQSDAEPDALERQIIFSGAYGNMRARVEKSIVPPDGARSVRRNTLRYLLSRIFPGADELKKQFPLLDRAPALLPPIWLFRLVRAPFVRGGAVLDECRVLYQINHNKEKEA